MNYRLKVTIKYERTRLLLIRLITFILAGLFVFAGLEKWVDPTAFELSLFHFDAFPDWLIRPIVWIIPLFEISAGLMCLFPQYCVQAIRILLALTLSYTLFLAIGWLRGISPDCGCLGSLSRHWPYSILFGRNLSLLILQMGLIHFADRPNSISHSKTYAENA